MEDTSRKPIPVLNKQGQQEVDARGKVVARKGNLDAGKLEVEDEDEKRYKTELEGANSWDVPAIKRRQDKERADKAARKASATASPSPAPSATATPEMPRKR